MTLALALIVFLTITIAIFAFGTAVAIPFSALGARLRALGWQKQAEPEKPGIKQRIQEVLDPLSKALPLSPSEASKTRVLLMQAGYREPRHITHYFASRLVGALLGLAVAVIVAGGTDSFLSFLIGGVGLGFLLPQFFLKQKIKARQRRIRALIFCFRKNWGDRKSTRLNSSHVKISYAVFCLKKKKQQKKNITKNDNQNPSYT